MSGRKQSEVVDLLRSGEYARDITMKHYIAEFTRYKQEFRSIGIECEKIENSSPIMKELSQESIIRFSDNSAQLKLKYNEIKKQFSRLSFDDVSRIESNIEKNERNIHICNVEAELIRKAISAKNMGYCDAEYEQADKLKQRYENVVLDQKLQVDKMGKLVQKASEQFARNKELINKIKVVNREIENLNKMAQSAKEADIIKKQLKSSLEECSKAVVKKFANTEYTILDANLKKYMSQDDNYVISNVSKFQNKISEFKTLLSDCIANYQQEKSALENMASQAAVITNTTYVDPMDYYSDGDEAVQTKMFAYLDRYIDSDYEARYNKARDKAWRYLQAEKFSEAKEQFEQVIEIVTEAKDKAINLQENMLKKMELAVAIEEVMHDLNYDTESSIINDNPNDGFRIVCHVGGTVIDFTNINYDEDGKPVIDIDHKESVVGTCGQSWQAITKAMQKNGIPVVDVTKNGNSIFTNKKSLTSVENNSMRVIKR